MTQPVEVWNEAQLLAPWIISYISTATGGDTGYLADSKLWLNTNHSPTMLDNAWLYTPEAGNILDREREIGPSGGLATATGRLNTVVDYNTAPQSGDRYLITTIQPRLLFNSMVSSLHRFYVPLVLPLGVFVDSDMDGTSGATLSGAGSFTKVTAAANVAIGRQSGFFNAGTAGETLTFPSVTVASGEEYFASVIIRVDAGGPFYLALYDVTNSAEIEDGNRVSTSDEGFRSLQRRFRVPPNCKEVAVRIVCTGASDDAYIGGVFGPWKASDRVLNLTSRIDNTAQIRKILRADYQHQISSGVYDYRSRAFIEDDRFYHDYAVRINPGAANPAVLEFQPGSSLPMAELYSEVVVRADQYYTLAFTDAGETAPDVPIDVYHWAVATVVDWCRMVIRDNPEHKRALGTLADLQPIITRIEEQYAALDSQTPSLPPAIPVRRLGGN